MCRHPLDPTKRVNCTPTRVVELLECVWNGRPTMDPPVFFFVFFVFFVFVLFHRECVWNGRPPYMDSPPRFFFGGGVFLFLSWAVTGSNRLLLWSSRFGV